MTHVLTLLDDPARAGLTPAHVETARAAIALAGAEAGHPEWLAEGVACDVPLAPAGTTTAALEAAVYDALGKAPIDYAVQPLECRRKALLVADMESTIIGQEMLDELGDQVGKRAEIASVTERAMRGELDFEAALAARVELLTDLPESLLAETSERMTLNPGAATLVATLRHHGVTCALVSGGFTIFAEAIADKLGFDVVRANTLEVRAGRLTGRVSPPVLGREAKLETLRELCRHKNLPTAAAAAVGDGANDLAMLDAAGLGVAYRAKPVVREAARFRLDHGDLTGLLFLQGYHKDELV